MADHQAARTILDGGDEEAVLLREFLEQGKGVTRKILDVGGWPAGKSILLERPEARCRVVVLLCRLLAEGNQRRSSETFRVVRRGGLRMTEWNPQGLMEPVGWTFRQGLQMKALISRLMRSRLPFDDQQLVCLVDTLCVEEAWNWKVPVAPVVTAVERHVREYGLSQELRRAVEALRKAGLEHHWVALSKAVRSRLDRILPNGP